MPVRPQQSPRDERPPRSRIRRAPRARGARRVPPPPRVPPAHRHDRRARRRRSPPSSTPTRWSPRRPSASAARRSPRRATCPIDTFVVLMMENRSLRPLPRLAAGRRRPPGRASPTPTRQGKTHSTRRLAPDWQGCGHPDPDHSWKGGRTQLNGGKCDGFLRSGDNDEFAISYYAGGRPRLHPGRGQGVHDLRPLPLLADGARRCPTASTCTPAQSYGLHRQRPAAADRAPDRLPRHHDLRRARRPRASPTATSTTTCPSAALWGAPGLARSGPVAGVLRALRDRHAARASPSSIPTSAAASARARALGRRAPARRRAHRPGVHGRRRPRVHGVAAVQARRAVHRLRRVGRLLRPRPPAARARRPQRPRHRQGLRADGLPHPGGRRLAVRPPRPRRAHDLRLRVDPEDDRVPLRAQAAHAPRRATRSNIARSFDWRVQAAPRRSRTSRDPSTSSASRAPATRRRRRPSAPRTTT